MGIAIKDFRMALRIDNSEAKQALVQTKEKIDAVKKELEELIRVGQKESIEYQQKKVLLDDLNNKYNEQRQVVGLTSLTYSELKKGARSLRAQLDNTVPGSEKWKNLDRDLKITEARMKELRTTAVETKLSVSKLADGFNKYAAVGAGAIAALTGIAMTARKCVDEYAAMQEAQSQVRKYTGMTTEEVSALNEEFKKMDTRTARTKLNEIAGDAGKLGVQGKKDVLDFVDAADKINVALGDDLGADAVKNIGKLAMIFGEDKKKGLRGAMLATGSAVNEVGQVSSAAEDYLVGFTARVAGTANQAKIAQGDILGYASVLDQNMQQQEMAATAFQTLMMKMFQDPATYAQIAGVEVKKFTKLIKEDANEAILTFLESLNNQGGFDKLAPMFDKMGLEGVRASGVLSTMAGKIDDIRTAQSAANAAYEKGTSIISEYNVQNSTVQAELDKAKKRFADIRVELGEQLMPLMKGMVSTGTLTVKGLSILVSIMTQYKGVIISATAAIAAYTLAVKANTLWAKICTAATKGAAEATLLWNKVTKASPWGLVIAGITALTTYLVFFRKSTDDATDAQRRFNQELEETKDAMDRIAGVKTRGANLDTLNERQKQELKSDAQAEVNVIEDKMSKETTAFRKYYKEQSAIIKQRNDIDDAQKKALLRSLDIEADEKAQELSKMLDQKNELQGIINKIPDSKVIAGKGTLPDDSNKKPWNTKLQELENTYAKEVMMMKQQSDLRGQSESEYHMDSLQKEAEYQAQRIAIIRSYQSKAKNKEDKAELGKLEVDTLEDNYNTLKQAEISRYNLMKEYRDIRIETVTAGEQKLKLELAKHYEQGGIQEKDYKNRLLTIDLITAQERLTIAQEFAKDVSDIELRNAEDKAQFVKDAGNQIIVAESDIAEKRGKIIQESAEQINALADRMDKKDSESYNERLSTLENFYQSQYKLAEDNGLNTTLLTKAYEEAKKQISKDYSQERAEVAKKYDIESAEQIRDQKLLLLEDEHRKGLLSEEEYAAAKNKIQNDYLKDWLKDKQQYVDAAMNIMRDASAAVQGFQDAEVSKVSRSYDKKIKAAKKAGKDTTKLEEEKEAAVSDVKRKYASMQFAMNVMQTISATAMSAMLAYSALAGIPVVGPVLGAAAAAAAIAAGAGQIAIAKEQRDEAMGLKSGGYSQDYVEGYTKAGSNDDVAGTIPVHGNEFVANHEAVANPHVRQFLDVFDVAQRNGSIRMINTTQILQNISTRFGKYEGGYTTSTEKLGTQEPVSSQNGDTGNIQAQIIKILKRCEVLLDIIAKKKLLVNARDVRDEIRKIDVLEKNISR